MSTRASMRGEVPSPTHERGRSYRRRLVLRVRFRAFSEAVSSSLFFLPALFVLAAILLAEALLVLDAHVASDALPPFFRTTVASARSFLGTIAGAVITVTGLVFSLSVVAVQLASSQYSPRALRTLFRSRFQQVVMGFMVGTFTYCLVVLHDIRSPLRDSGEAVIPSVSIVGTFVLAVLALLAILAYVDFVARSMQVTEIIRRITVEAMATVERLAPKEQRPVEADESGRGTRSPPTRAAMSIPPQAEEGATSLIIRSRRGGWVQQADSDVLLSALPADTTLRLAVRVGFYVSPEMPLCEVWPRPVGKRETLQIVQVIHSAIRIGGVRTMQADVAFGLQQLSDIALRALSPGINDPRTADEAIRHLGTVLRALLRGQLPPVIRRDGGGRVLLRADELSQAAYVDLAFNQIRVAGSAQPDIAMLLLSTLGMLLDEASQSDDHETIATLRQQAALVLAGCQAASPLPHDEARVRAAAREAGFACRRADASAT